MTMPSDQSELPPDSSWSAFRYRDFRWVFIANFLANIGAQMQLMVVNWDVWRITQDKFALGLVGLVRILPIIVFSLVGGVIADAYDRRKLLIGVYTATMGFASVLAVASLSGQASIALIYAITALMSGLVALREPARAALLPNLVPPGQVANAVRLNSLLFTATAVLGPIFAGLLLAVARPGVAYAISAASFIVPVVVLPFIHPRASVGGEKREISLKAFREGWTFVWNKPLLWASMVLDFWATFFSSAMALLPVYATEILLVGPLGYGILSAAPAIGSIIGSAAMAQLGGRVRRQGEVMLWAVAVYGLATIIFGLSGAFLLSLLALGLTGLADSVSTMIRATLRQLLTPDRLRGRMISVNMIFYIGGPQLGEFEAGALAQITSAPFSVVFGGVGTLAVVALMAISMPVLRQYREAPQPFVG